MTKPLLENEIRQKNSQNLIATDESIPAIDDSINTEPEKIVNITPPTQNGTSFSPSSDISIHELKANTRKYCRRFSEEVDQE